MKLSSILVAAASVAAPSRTRAFAPQSQRRTISRRSPPSSSLDMSSGGALDVEEGGDDGALPFKTDGISKNYFLDRDPVVQSLVGRARRHQHIVLGSPPATGKSSLLMMLKWKLEGIGVKVHKRTIDKTDDSRELLDWLATKGIVEDEDSLQKLQETWILLDDAQNAYNAEAEGFWQFVVKGIQCAGVEDKIFVVIASTYDRAIGAGDSSVVWFRGLEHMDPNFSKDEARALFTMYAGRMGWCLDWDNYENALSRLSALSGERIHVGVVILGLKLLDSMRKRASRSHIFCESMAVTELRGLSFLLDLGRCFGLGMRSTFDAMAIKDIVADAVISGSVVDISERIAAAPLLRAGILDRNGKFTCLAAKWYYNQKCFPSRATTTPASLDVLVEESVSKMSAKRLRDTLHDGFPKEATLQHLFNENMNMLLPVENYAIPEFNTFTVDSNGDPVHGELDFYINGNLQWCLELLRQGDKIGEHLARFDKEIGKYREVQPREYLVVDCRGPKQGSVEVNESRCTLYFAEDFGSCICKMRLQDEKTIVLEP